MYFLLFIAHASSTVWDTAYMLPWFWAFQFVYLLVVVFCLEATAAALAYVNAGKVLRYIYMAVQNYRKSTHHRI